MKRNEERREEKQGAEKSKSKKKQSREGRGGRIWDARYTRWRKRDT
jgi:hypothetical protein